MHLNLRAHSGTPHSRNAAERPEVPGLLEEADDLPAVLKVKVDALAARGLIEAWH